MSSPVLNRVWCQTLRIKPSTYEIFYKTGLIWVTLMLTLGFTIACLLSALAFVCLKARASKVCWALYLSPEGVCRYYPPVSGATAIICKPIAVRHALFWCHVALQSDDGQCYRLVFWLHCLTSQEKRRFNALCHNWSQEILA